MKINRTIGSINFFGNTIENISTQLEFENKEEFMAYSEYELSQAEFLIDFLQQDFSNIIKNLVPGVQNTLKLNIKNVEREDQEEELVTKSPSCSFKIPSSLQQASNELQTMIKEEINNIKLNTPIGITFKQISSIYDLEDM